MFHLFAYIWGSATPIYLLYLLFLALGGGEPKEP